MNGGEFKGEMGEREAGQFRNLTRDGLCGCCGELGAVIATWRSWLCVKIGGWCFCAELGIG